MKKIWTILVSIVYLSNVSAMSFVEGKQYIELDRRIVNEPKVIEFFSFYCLHCYQFEQIYHISSVIKKALPPGMQMIRYHVNFLEPMGKQLTQAWAVAIALGLEDKVSPLLFDGIQKTNSIQTDDDIRAVFRKVGLSSEEYNASLDSFFVKSLVEQQEKAANDLQLRGVPAIFINGKYMIKNDGLDMSSIDAYTKHLSDVVKFLLVKE